jgi:AhpD family alkylhydroperoxidase
LQRAGRLPNSARALANAGDLGAATRTFFEDIWEMGTLPKALRLLIRYKVSSTNACLYCAAHQRHFLEKLGVPAAKIAHIHEFERHPVFDERERAALAFAQALTVDSANIPSAIQSRFCSAFSAAERTEIAIVAAAMGFLNTFNDGMKIPIENEVVDVAMEVQRDLAAS